MTETREMAIGRWTNHTVPLIKFIDYLRKQGGRFDMDEADIEAMVDDVITVLGVPADEATRERLQERDALERLIAAGAGLANAAFNLSQVRDLGEHTRRSLKDGCNEWDAARKELLAQRSETRAETEKPFYVLECFEYGQGRGYWCGVRKFSFDIEEAVQFCRQKDAQLAKISLHQLGNISVTEHIRSGSYRPSPTGEGL